MAVFRSRNARAQAAVEVRLADAIAELGPLLRLETGRIELLEYLAVEGVVVLRVEGDCPHCDLTAARLVQGIEAHLRTRVPAIREVRIASNG